MRARQRGNTLALTVSSVGVILLAVGFFAINYAQLIGTQKQAQTAIDAAALQAASDISQVAFNGRSGRVAIADQLPRNNNLNRPAVKSINKVLATARLDLLIAAQVGNRHLADLAAMDIENALQDAAGLARAIQASLPQIRSRAQEVYDRNNRRLSRGRRIGDLTVALGRFANAANAVTNIPVPSPIEMAQVNSTTSVRRGNTTLYRAQVNVPVSAAGRTFNITFFGTGNEEALVPNNEFRAVASTEAPCLVQVSANEEVNGLAPGLRQRQKGTIRAVATAQCGGHLINEPTGTFTLSFRGGLPNNGNNLNFDSIANIMNSSGWNPQSPGNWFKAFNGHVPVYGSSPGDSGGRLVRARYRGELQNTPNDALASMVHDWLRTSGLRPNIKAVKQALQANIRTMPSSPQTYPMANGFTLIPSAHAQAQGENLPVAAALFDVNDDPRSQENFDRNPQKYGEQIANILNYKPAAATIAETALACAIDESGTPVTTDGHDIGVLSEFFLNLSRFSSVCKDSFQSGQQVAKESFEALKEPVAKAATLLTDKAFLKGQIDEMQKNHPENTGAIAAFDERVKEIDSSLTTLEATIAEGVRKFKRAEFVMLNADYGMHTVAAIQKNMKGLTAGGVEKRSDNHFKVHSTNYLPAITPATKAEIEGEGPIATGQHAMARLKDWAAPARNGKCQLEFFDSEMAPLAHAPAEVPSLIQPALAATSVPVSGNYLFNLNVHGSAALPDKFGTGEVSLLKSESTLYGPSLLEGQFLYQNVKAIAQQRPGKPTLYWQAMGRNHVASVDGTYFADTTAPGFHVVVKTWCSVIYGNAATQDPAVTCPALASEFVITCPMPGGECKPETFYVGGAWTRAGTNGFGGDERPYTVSQAKNILNLANAVIANPTSAANRNAFWIALRGYVQSNDVQTTLLWAYVVHYSLSATGEYSFKWYTPTNGWQQYQGYGIDIRTVVPCAKIVIEHG